MPRRRLGRGGRAQGDSAAGNELLDLSAWGLQPAQWRPVGSMSLVRERAVLLWRLEPNGGPAPDTALRARRAYDRLGELGVTVAADASRDGIEVTIPLSRVGLALRILADRSILPDAVLLTDPPAERLRALRREIGAHRRAVELVIGHEGSPDPILELQARLRAT